MHPKLYALPFWIVAAAALFLGCSRPAVPDPRTTAGAYAKAVEAGDDAAVYALLTTSSQARYGREEVRRLLKEGQAELKNNAKAIRVGPVEVEAQASVRFEDGEVATLAIRRGGFWVESVQALPPRPTTPAEALAQLRAALARGSYAALLSVLSKETREAMQRDLEALQVGLEDPDAALIHVTGDEARARLPNGHLISLVREDGIWRVDDLD